MLPQPPRLCPHRDLPPYAFVPGHWPHPVSDPRGHSFKHTAPTVVPLATTSWLANQEYLFGFDLFNQGYYWEAHEVWEALWRLAERNGVLATLLKGLIKLAAAGVKAREGVPAGLASHASRATELFVETRALSGEGECCGLDLRRLVCLASESATMQLPPAAAASLSVARVFPFNLVPSLAAETHDG